MLQRTILASLATMALLALVASPASSTGNIAPVPQGLQSDTAYAASFAARGAHDVSATTQRTSCYTPEVPYFTIDPGEGYTGMTACAPGTATTGEAAGPYATQAGSNSGFPAATPMLVKGHSESDIRADPTDPKHLIGQSKWFVSAEGYNHFLGFFESFDGGTTWPAQGHVPGFEGWTDNTDPVGAFDSFGNFYSFVLAYQFFYNADGTHNFTINPNQAPDPALPAEVVGVAVRPHGATTATQWLTQHGGALDVIAQYPARGREPDKQWIAIDTNPASPFFDRIYAMWVVFDGFFTPQPFVAWAQAHADGTHSDWSSPIPLPQIGGTPQGATFLLPQVTPDGTVYTTLVNETPAHGSFDSTIFLDQSHDGGVTWSASPIVRDITNPPGHFTNTTFRDGITETFGVGHALVNGHYPLYVAWEDGSAGVSNILLAASYDGGGSWTSPIQVNDNTTPADEFQPNLSVTANGTVAVAFYDRRLPCAAQGTAEATAAGLALDTANPRSPNTPPYGATNYCVNTSVQFYTPALAPKGQNIRLSAHGWDPQLNAPHPGCAACAGTFIGDYFGITSANGTLYTTSVSTYDMGSNPRHYQQQVIGSVAIP